MGRWLVKRDKVPRALKTAPLFLSHHLLLITIYRTGFTVSPSSYREKILCRFYRLGGGCKNASKGDKGESDVFSHFLLKRLSFQRAPHCFSRLSTSRVSYFRERERELVDLEQGKRPLAHAIDRDLVWVLRLQLDRRIVNK